MNQQTERTYTQSEVDELTRTAAVNAAATQRESDAKCVEGSEVSGILCACEDIIRANPLPTELTDYLNTVKQQYLEQRMSDDMAWTTRLNTERVNAAAGMREAILQELEMRRVSYADEPEMIQAIDAAIAMCNLPLSASHQSFVQKQVALAYERCQKHIEDDLEAGYKVSRMDYARKYKEWAASSRLPRKT